MVTDSSLPHSIQQDRNNTLDLQHHTILAHKGQGLLSDSRHIPWCNGLFFYHFSTSRGEISLCRVEQEVFTYVGQCFFLTNTLDQRVQSCVWTEPWPALLKFISALDVVIYMWQARPVAFRRIRRGIKYDGASRRWRARTYELNRVTNAVCKPDCDSPASRIRPKHNVHRARKAFRCTDQLLRHAEYQSRRLYPGTRQPSF